MFDRLRQRLAALIAPAAPVAAPKPKRQRRARPTPAPQAPQASPDQSVAPVARAGALPDYIAPVSRQEDGALPPEFEALVTVHWGDMPLAASLTRARARAVMRNPNATRQDVLSAIEGTVIDIP